MYLKSSLRLEIKYFEQYCSETCLTYPKLKPQRRLKSEILMKLWQECYAFFERDRDISFWFKIKSAFVYGISDWKFYKNNLPAIITLLQSLFYQARLSGISNEIVTLEKQLAVMDAKGKMEELTGWYMDYLRAKLFERYGKQHERNLFTDNDLWMKPNDVVKEYPIVLRTRPFLFRDIK